MESIADQAEQASANGAAGDVPDAPPIPPLEGDGQLTLNLGTLARGPVEAEVSLMGASVPLEGMLVPGEEALLAVSVLPHSYRYVPVRENGRVVRWKLRLQVRPTSVRRVRAEDASGAA